MDYIPVIKLRQEVIREAPIKCKRLSSVTSVVDYAQELIGDCDRETVIVFGLSTKSDINFISTVSASSMVSSSSSGIGRRSTLMPISSANCIRLLLVIEGRIEDDFGVMYVLSLIPKKFAAPHSSIYFFSFASR